LIIENNGAKLDSEHLKSLLINFINQLKRLVMKTVCFVLAFILCQGITHSQDWSQLPELPVWYELENTSFGKNMSYFPNFDTARGGFNALTHYIAGQQNPTWYNRYKGDTENMFDWGGAFKRVHVRRF